MSIDEGCMDISHIKMDRLELANLIQENVRIKTGLSISIGISYNMSLAKLASDWNKPHGIKIITQDDIPNILLDLKVGKIQGIGRKSEEKLNKIGIKKVSDLYDLSRNNLRELFGKFGEVIYDRIRGIDERQLDLSRIRKSIGVEYTFERDLKNYNELLNKASEFSEELSDDIHTHILIETKTTENLSKYMHCLNTRYGLYYNKKYKRTGYVFRDRYKAEGIYSEEQLHNCIKYIYDNPVKAGICDKAEEYEFSNYKKINFTNTREYTFIDIEEDKRVECNKLVKEFLKVKKIKLEELKSNKTELGELVKILKKHKISFRIISNIIKINREKTYVKKYNIIDIITKQ